MATRNEDEVKKAATAICKWLATPDDALRAYLTIVSGAGVVFAGQCEEKVMRAYVVVNNISVQDFCAAAIARLCTDAGASMGQPTQDDFALTQWD